MNDPYKVLGVTRSSTEDEIKNAYRIKARMINENGGENAAVAMNELNDAYDEVIGQARSYNKGGYQNGGYNSYNCGQNNSYGGANNYSGYQNSYRSSGNYSDIRSMLNSNRLSEAEQLLDGMPNGSRDAEWYFLKGWLLQKKGWLEEAFTHYSTACRMDPHNMEYRNALNNMSGYNRGSYNGGYRTGPAYNQNRGCSGCDVCSSLLCADCCCECMGGDLIRCC